MLSGQRENFQRKYKSSREKLQVPNHRDVSVLQLALKGLVGRPSVRFDKVNLVRVDIRCRSQVVILGRHGEWMGVSGYTLGLKYPGSFIC
jgi:hypothetical protein